MSGLEVMLNRRWVLKAQDKELYYKIRDEIGEIRKFASDKMGCLITENSILVKMEKIPVVPESFMGIREFGSREEYAMLCILLMFLEDRDAQEQFILSQLTEYVAANMPGEAIDWTLYTNRRRMIRVLRYAVAQGLLCITDGSDDIFMDDAGGEVLYENTGASRYFMRSFTKDILAYTSPEDFRGSDWFEMDEDRGIARRHRVYKRLLFAPGMFKENGAEEDFDYLKYYGRRLAEDLEQVFDCSVQIHKGSAYMMLGENCQMGAVFPGNNVLSDIVLLCCHKIREKIEAGEWELLGDERCVVDMLAFERLIRDVRQENAEFFSKNYKEMPESEFVRSVMDEMECWMFLRRMEKEHQVVIYPSAGKLQGCYPMEYVGESTDEQ